VVVVYKNVMGLDGLARWVILQHYFGTTLLKGCRPLFYRLGDLPGQSERSESDTNILPLFFQPVAYFFTYADSSIWWSKCRYDILHVNFM